VLICLGGNEAGYEERVGHDWHDLHMPAAEQVVDN
jgi:hypothetical protein